MTGPGTNWGGNVRYRASRVERPATVAELQALCAGADQLAVVATRHTFNTIGDADVLVSLELLGEEPWVEAGSVSVSPATTYAELARVLHASGAALHNLASLPHISVGGAVATATHGSGSDRQCLASAVESVDMVCSDGSTHRIARGHPDFDGAVVGLGALGVVTRYRLAIEPTYGVSQTVYDGLTWNVLTSSFDDLMRSATSVSVFTRWGDQVGEVWAKQRVDAASANAPADFGLTPASELRHPVPGADGTVCTAQLGSVGPWWNRLPHFRADAEPSVGAEIQSEVFVDRTRSAEAIDAMRSIGAQLDAALLVGEIRTVAADRFWMSPLFDRDSTAFHFTWRPDARMAQTAVDLVARTLAPFAPRHHPGKALPTGWLTRDSMPRVSEFLDLKARFDERNAFTTPWFTRHIGNARER